MRPPFAYYGGKSRMARWIASLLPPHRVYVEPFAGSAAVLFAKQPARHEILNDVDGEVVNFFRVLRERTDDLAAACMLTPYGRDEYDAALAVDLPSHEPLERARLWWVRSSQGFGQSASMHTGWSISTDQRVNRPNHVQNRVGSTFYAAARRMTGVFVENADALDVLRRYCDAPDVAVYCDPPYLGSTRTSHTDGGGRRPRGDYVHDYATEAEHRALAETLRQLPAAVLLSGYHSPLYDELYDGWHRLEREVPLHSSNGKSGVRAARRTEVVWSNRPVGQMELGTLDLEARA